MSKANWKEILGWGEQQLDELRLSGFSFLREGKYDKALLFYQTLVIVDPTNAYDFQTLGALYLQMGNKESAHKTLTRALELDPVHEPTLLNMTKTLLLLEDKSAAFALAKRLAFSKDATIAGDASALLSAYT